MDEMLRHVGPAVQRAIESGVSGRDAAEIHTFVESGDRIRGWLLEHVHHEASSTTTPDLLELKRAMDVWADAALSLALA